MRCLSWCLKYRSLLPPSMESNPSLINFTYWSWLHPLEAPQKVRTPGSIPRDFPTPLLPLPSRTHSLPTATCGLHSHSTPPGRWIPSQMSPRSWNPALQLHRPTGTSHSPSAPQCMRGGLPGSPSECATHVPVTSTSVEKALSAAVAGNAARPRTVARHCL